MTLYDYMWLCMTIYDYVWLCCTLAEIYHRNPQLIQQQTHNQPHSPSPVQIVWVIQAPQKFQLQNCVVYISVTRYSSEVILYSIRTGGYPLTRALKLSLDTWMIWSLPRQIFNSSKLVLDKTSPVPVRLPYTGLESWDQPNRLHHQQHE